jgi:hypothetical protein
MTPALGWQLPGAVTEGAIPVATARARDPALAAWVWRPGWSWPGRAKERRRCGCVTFRIAYSSRCQLDRGHQPRYNRADLQTLMELQLAVLEAEQLWMQQVQGADGSSSRAPARSGPRRRVASHQPSLRGGDHPDPVRARSAAKTGRGPLPVGSVTIWIAGRVRRSVACAGRGDFFRGGQVYQDIAFDTQQETRQRLGPAIRALQQPQS